MLEIPEALVVSRQLNETIAGKTIRSAVAGASPHGFAWYYGDPLAYNSRLAGHTVQKADAYAGNVMLFADDAILRFADGVNLRYYAAGEKRPDKHQLLVAFDDDSVLIGTVAMYGGIWCFQPGDFDEDFYYRVSRDRPSPLTDTFDYAYFLSLFDDKSLKLSAKAFLATEQRIPGLGNGVLQDILLNARIHPKKKVNTLSDAQKQAMFDSVKATLAEMLVGGGRDTERDLFGNAGGYKTKLSRNTKTGLCANCGGEVKKESYLGGSIYYCQQCQVR